MGVDHFETFVLTVSATSNRSIATMECKLDRDLRNEDVGQAFIRPELDPDIRWHLPPGC